MKLKGNRIFGVGSATVTLIVPIFNEMNPTGWKCTYPDSLRNVGIFGQVFLFIENLVVQGNAGSPPDIAQSLETVPRRKYTFPVLDLPPHED